MTPTGAPRLSLEPTHRRKEGNSHRGWPPFFEAGPGPLFSWCYRQWAVTVRKLLLASHHSLPKNSIDTHSPVVPLSSLDQLLRKGRIFNDSCSFLTVFPCVCCFRVLALHWFGAVCFGRQEWNRTREAAHLSIVGCFDTVFGNCFIGEIMSSVCFYHLFWFFFFFFCYQQCYQTHFGWCNQLITIIRHWHTAKSKQTC